MADDAHDTTGLTVIQSEHLSPSAAQWLAERHRLITIAHDDPAFAEHMHQADALIVRTYTNVDTSLLDHAPKLRVVGRAGAGLDNIDITACRQRNIEVVYTPDANTQAVVEYVMCLLLDHVRPRVALTHALDTAAWNTLRAQTVGKRELAQLTLGILGLGRVGRRLSRAAAGLGMHVLYNDLLDIAPDRRFGAVPVSVDDLFQRADVVSIHIDGRASNRHFVDQSLLQQMKPDVIFLNASRGFVVNTHALAAFLADHPQALAMLDVHDPEPVSPDSPLLKLPNAVLYPHLASRTEQAMENMSWVVRDVDAVLRGQQPQYPAPS